MRSARKEWREELEKRGKELKIRKGGECKERMERSVRKERKRVNERVRSARKGLKEVLGKREKE